MTKYAIIIHWSHEDQVFVAEVPELPGCCTHGSTQEAALASAQEAIHHWIQTALEFGDPIPRQGPAIDLGLRSAPWRI